MRKPIRKKEEMGGCTYSLSFLIIKLEQLKAAVIFQRSVQVPHTFVHFGNHCVVGEPLTEQKRLSNGRYTEELNIFWIMSLDFISSL